MLGLQDPHGLLLPPRAPQALRWGLGPRQRLRLLVLIPAGAPGHRSAPSLPSSRSGDEAAERFSQQFLLLEGLWGSLMRPIPSLQHKEPVLGCTHQHHEHPIITAGSSSSAPPNPDRDPLLLWGGLQLLLQEATGSRFKRRSPKAPSQAKHSRIP